MADKVAFELVSPEKLLFSAEVDMVVVPGSEGDFGVLPGHSPFISTVRAGVLPAATARAAAPDPIVESIAVAARGRVEVLARTRDDDLDRKSVV